MNTYQMKLFLETVKCMNFTEAAERMYTSQPSLSRQISSIEAELNVQLFVRSRNKVILTPAGKALYEGLSDVYPMYEEVVRRTIRANRGVIDVLKLGVLEDALLPKQICDFSALLQEKYPNVNLELKNEGFLSLTDGLRDGRFDAIITLSNDLRDKRWTEYLVLERLPLFLVVRAEHPIADRAEISLYEFPALLKDDTFILMSASDSKGSADDALNTLVSVDFHPPIKYASTPTALTLQVIAGQGVTIVNNRHAQVNNPELRFIQIIGVGKSEVVLAWNRDNDSESLAFLLKHIRKIMSEES